MKFSDYQVLMPLSCSAAKTKTIYIPVRVKFNLCFLIAILWAGVSIYLADLWISGLALHVPYFVAALAVYSIAVIPGFMYTFTAASLLFDDRPCMKPLPGYPGLSVLVPCYNEVGNIAATIRSIRDNEYEGELEIIVIDDGSTDGTSQLIEKVPGITVIKNEHAGKAAALNAGMDKALHQFIVSIDSDTLLRKNALENITRRLLSDPPNTAAVAGAVMARNSRKNFLTRMQEWDYFHGIGAIKRMQSLFQGTLVAQGAFSIYRKSALKEMKGWRSVVGEDIVLTWAFLSAGYRTGFAENAVSFTNVPETIAAFYQQRKRWARGMIESFKLNPGIMFSLRFSTLFIFWNITFPLLDAMYLFVLVPGIILALFGFYYIAGALTLLLIPQTLIMNYLMYSIQKNMFDSQGLHVRRNYTGFLSYIALYQLLMAPASLAGYFAEGLSLNKKWGSRV